MFRKGLILAALTVAVGGVAQPADVAAQDVKAVETRQALMRTLGGTMTAIAGYLKEGKGTAVEVEAQVLVMAGLAGELPALFPKGTDKDALGLNVSGSNPQIWTDWAGFQAASAKLGTEARTLAGVIRGGDKATLGQAFGAFGKSACGGCHGDFRTKRPN